MFELRVDHHDGESIKPYGGYVEKYDHGDHAWRAFYEKVGRLYVQPVSHFGSVVTLKRERQTLESVLVRDVRPF